MLREPVTILRFRKPIVMARHDSVTDAVRAMKGENRGVVLVTEDGTPGTPLVGIFTERDVLLRIVDGGRNPAILPVGEVMTPEPEGLYEDETIAAALHQMSVGGFRHVPVVDRARLPCFVLSVRDVVQFLVEHFPREILNMGPDRHRQHGLHQREGG
jgi:CBS domain-containing protein